MKGGSYTRENPETVPVPVAPVPAANPDAPAATPVPAANPDTPAATPVPAAPVPAPATNSPPEVK